jgi:hypothetical protein
MGMREFLLSPGLVFVSGRVRSRRVFRMIRLIGLDGFGDHPDMLILALDRAEAGTADAADQQATDWVPAGGALHGLFPFSRGA